MTQHQVSTDFMDVKPEEEKEGKKHVMSRLLNMPMDARIQQQEINRRSWPVG